MTHNSYPESNVLTLDSPVSEVLVEERVLKEIDNAKLIYRQEFEDIARAKQGQISALETKILDALRIRLGLTLEEAFAIKEEVVKPYRDYQQKLHEYKRAFVEAIRHEYVINSKTRQDLKRLQELFGLKEEDVLSLEAQVMQKRKSGSGNKLVLIVTVMSLVLVAGIGSWIMVSLMKPVGQQQNSQNPTYTAPIRN